MAGMPINSNPMMQYEQMLNQTVASAIGPTAPTTVSPYGAPAGFQAPPVAPSNTHFSGSPNMLDPGAQAGAQAAADAAAKNTPSAGQKAQQALSNPMVLGVGALALAAGGYGVYNHNQNKKAAAAESQKSGSDSNSTKSSGNSSAHPPTASSKTSAGSAAEEKKPAANSSHGSAQRSSTHGSAPHATGKGATLAGGLEGLGMFTSSLFGKKKPSFKMKEARPANSFNQTPNTGHTRTPQDSQLSSRERKTLAGNDAQRAKDRQAQSEASLNSDYKKLSGENTDFSKMTPEDKQKFVHGQKQKTAEREQKLVDDLPSDASKKAFSNLSPTDRSYYANLSATDKEKFLADPAAFKAEAAKPQPEPLMEIPGGFQPVL